jgi:hypothetical protein
MIEGAKTLPNPSETAIGKRDGHRDELRGLARGLQEKGRQAAEGRFFGAHTCSCVHERRPPVFKASRRTRRHFLSHRRLRISSPTLGSLCAFDFFLSGGVYAAHRGALPVGLERVGQFVGEVGARPTQLLLARVHAGHALPDARGEEVEEVRLDVAASWTYSQS